MKTSFSTGIKAFAVIIAMAILVVGSERIVRAVSYNPSNSSAPSSGVDCIGDGAACEGHLRGSSGYVIVANNKDPHYFWQFKLTCDFGGDQYSVYYRPSPDPVKSDQLTCKFGAQAKYWNVLVDYRA